jgi:hypothetical protein
MMKAKTLQAVLLLAGFWALPSEAQRQCAADRPCLGPIYNQGANLIVEWSDPGNSNHWNFSWSRDGMDVWNDFDVKNMRFTIRNFHANTRYQFRVQGCYKPLLQRSVCSPIEEITVRSCGAKSNPCR